MVQPFGIGNLSNREPGNPEELARLQALILDLQNRLNNLAKPASSQPTAVPIEELLPVVHESMVQLLQPSLRNDLRANVFAQILDRLCNVGVSNLEIYRLETVIADVLPFLAHQFAILGYRGYKYVEGNEAGQRNIIQNAIGLQHLTGSLQGFKAAAELAGGEVVAYIAPPNLAYPGRDWTIEERNSYLALMPKLQTFRLDRQGKPGTRFFCNKTFAYSGAETDEPSRDIPFLSSDVYQRYFEQIYLVQPDGTKSRVNSYALDVENLPADGTVVQRVQMPAKALGVYPKFDIAGAPRIPGTRDQKFFARESTARERLYTLTFEKPYEFTKATIAKQTIVPGLEQINVQYDLRQIRAPLQTLCLGYAFPGSGRLQNGFSVPSDAEKRIYKEVFLHDPTLRFTAGYKGHVFANITRLGIAPFRAELQIQKHYKRPAFWHSGYVAGFIRPDEFDPFYDVVRTTAEYKLARDQIMVTTRTIEPIRSNRSRYAGNFVLGQKEIYRRF